MSTFTPTDEQLEIIDAARSSSESLIINALAGAAKTTTLELICRALPPDPIISLAFNKRIAEEMKKRLPGNVASATMNSVGHRVWSAATGKRLVVDKDKSYLILKDIIGTLKGSDKSEAWDSFSDIRKAVSAAKMLGYVPEKGFENATRLILRSDFFDYFDEPFPEWQQHIIDQVLRTGITQAYAGAIDFDDQIYMPTLFGGAFPRYPRTMIDETQDLSPLNHAFVEKLVSGQLIAVGDPWQSIYAFRGAMTSSMALLGQKFNCRELTLSISFRCPRAVIRKAHSRVPHMRWPEWAIEGVVANLDSWDAATIPDNAAIICRNNAPLFSCALALLKHGRGVQLIGTDLGPSLIRTLKKLGPEDLPQTQTLDAIEEWKQTTLKKSKNAGSVVDKAECLSVFARAGDSLGAAVAYADHIFKAKGPVQLLSGHKAKGLEWNTVYHLDPHRVPSPFAKDFESREQELNVRYVIETRAKQELYLMTMESFNGDIS